MAGAATRPPWLRKARPGCLTFADLATHYYQVCWRPLLADYTRVPHVDFSLLVVQVYPE